MTKDIRTEEGYIPSENEPFMNEKQRMYFKNLLLKWRDQLLKESQENLKTIQDEYNQNPDIIDSASQETDRSIHLRSQDRERKLIKKIEEALTRIDDGSYGYCEETGEPISLKRLQARPIATLSIDAQERHERQERTYREH